MFCFLVMFTLWQIIYFSTIIFIASLLLLMDRYKLINFKIYLSIYICVCMYLRVYINHIYARLHQYFLSQINEHSYWATQKSGYFIANMSSVSSNMSATSESRKIVTSHWGFYIVLPHRMSFYIADLSSLLSINLIKCFSEYVSFLLAFCKYFIVYIVYMFCIYLI